MRGASRADVPGSPRGLGREANAASVPAQAAACEDEKQAEAEQDPRAGLRRCNRFLEFVDLFVLELLLFLILVPDSSYIALESMAM